MDGRGRLPVWRDARYAVLLVPPSGVPFGVGSGRGRRIPARHRGLPVLAPGPGLVGDRYPLPAGFHGRGIPRFRIAVAVPPAVRPLEQRRTSGGNGEVDGR